MELSGSYVAIDRHRLREYRQLAGLSGKALAAAVGCTPAYISTLENRDGRSCSPQVFAAICDALRLHDRRLLVRNPDGARSAA